jgi:hypothetical protein
MAPPRVKPRTIGKRTIVDVEVDAANPRFPPYCSCCLRKVEPDRTIRIWTRDKDRSFRVPSCGRCVRHAAVSDVLLYVVLAIIVVGFLGAAFYLGATAVEDDLPGGWRVFGGVLMILKFFLNPFYALAGFIAVVFTSGILFLAVFGTVWLIMAGKDCSSLTGAVDVVKQPTGLMFTFESREYGRRFADANKDP